jgi:hypothetical protein
MKVSLLGVGLLALTATVGFAQTGAAQAAPVPMQPHATAINQRRQHQQRRIAQGIRTGRLHASQAARLERREASIGRQEHRMRTTDRGRLTRVDRVRLNRRLHRISRAIYRAKHGNVKR